MKDGIVVLKCGKVFMNLIYKVKYLFEVFFKCKFDVLFFWFVFFNLMKFVLDFCFVEIWLYYLWN